MARKGKVKPKLAHGVDWHAWAWRCDVHGLVGADDIARTQESLLPWCRRCAELEKNRPGRPVRVKLVEVLN